MTARVNESIGIRGVSLWQPRFHDHIIREEDELSRVREYIVNNPLNWDTDEENPMNACPTDRL